MDSSAQIEQRAAEWLAKRDGDAWNDADEAEFAQWLQASTAHRVAYVRLNAAWYQASRLKALGAGIRPGIIPSPGDWRHSLFFEEPHRRPLSSHVGGEVEQVRVCEERVPRFAHRYRAVAASLIFAAALGIGWYVWWPTGPAYRTEVGGLAVVPMADGSRITLNTDSEIRVAVTDTERRIDLAQGEAFFEVAKDPARPFVVEAGSKRIVAIGTKFSVRRDESSAKEVLVVVTEGRVRVESAPHPLVKVVAPPAEVSAGSVARSGDAGMLIQEKPLAETEVMLSWRTGYLVFKDTDLADAVAEFNRYNTRKIIIEDAAVAGIRIGGNFRSTNVDAFVRLLEDGFPIRVEQHDRRIVLTSI